MTKWDCVLGQSVIHLKLKTSGREFQRRIYTILVGCTVQKLSIQVNLGLPGGICCSWDELEVLWCCYSPGWFIPAPWSCRSSLQNIPCCGFETNIMVFYWPTDTAPLSTELWSALSNSSTQAYWFPMKVNSSLILQFPKPLASPHTGCTSFLGTLWKRDSAWTPVWSLQIELNIGIKKFPLGSRSCATCTLWEAAPAQLCPDVLSQNCCMWCPGVASSICSKLQIVLLGHARGWHLPLQS